jgi:hypothetical protein
MRNSEWLFFYSRMESACCSAVRRIIVKLDGDCIDRIEPLWFTGE